MPLVSPQDTLTLTIKIPRELHDLNDEIRDLAKRKGMVFDPTPALIKALEKDIDAARRELQTNTEKHISIPE
jgi:hypothetical protein